MNPYQITPEILKLIASVSEKLGQINAKFLNRPSCFPKWDTRVKI